MPRVGRNEPLPERSVISRISFGSRLHLARYLILENRFGKTNPKLFSWRVQRPQIVIAIADLAHLVWLALLIWVSTGILELI